MSGEPFIFLFCGGGGLGAEPGQEVTLIWERARAGGKLITMVHDELRRVASRLISRGCSGGLAVADVTAALGVSRVAVETHGRLARFGLGGPLRRRDK
jgi:hypothetical protein